MKYMITRLSGYTTRYTVEAKNEREALKKTKNWEVLEDESLFETDVWVSHIETPDGEWKEILPGLPERLDLNDPLVN